jgi:phosphate transport system permease protein
MGIKYYDLFETSSGALVRKPVAGAAAPDDPVRAGDRVTDEDRHEFIINQTQLSSDPSPVQRLSEPEWYYLRVPFGRGVLAGGMTLMLVILPIVVIASQEALRAVPDSLREGALAAGATRWQMVRHMTLPAAVPGIMTGSILAMSRAIGEAAPVLVIAGIVFITFTPRNLMDDFTVLPLQIYNWAQRPQEEFHRIAATGIIVLLAVLLTFNAAAVLIRQKFHKPLQ